MKSLIILFVILFLAKSVSSQSIIIYNPENSELPDIEVNSVYIDENDNKWFGTNSGLAFFDEVSWIIYNDVSDYPISHNSINDLTNENSGLLWIGTDDGASLANYDENGIYATTIYNNRNSDITADTITSISIDGTNSLWFGGLNIISTFLNSSWDVIEDNILFNFYDISVIASTNDTTNFIGTNGGGVRLMFNNEIDGITGGTIYETPYSQLPSDNINAIFVDDSIQWFGTDIGIAKHLGLKAKENWIIYDELEGMPATDVRSIAKDNEGKMWFGTTEAVVILDDTTWSTYTTDDGLSSNMINDIAMETNGNVWLATNKGITKLQFSEPVTSLQANKIQSNIKTFPNPSSSNINIQFSITSPAFTDISIFNASGMLIYTISNSFLTNGNHSFIWNLEDLNRNRVTPGIYTLRIFSDDFIQTKKLLVI